MIGKLISGCCEEVKAWPKSNRNRDIRSGILLYRYGCKMIMGEGRENEEL